MSTPQITAAPPTKKNKRESRLVRAVRRHWGIYLLMLPGILFFVVFKYTPMWMLSVAFQDYNPYVGVMGSEWVGLKHFRTLFGDSLFYLMLRNTLMINILKLVFYFPVPILLALLINELMNDRFKKAVQTVIYLPHFLSWVIIASMTFFLFSVDVGLINKLAAYLGFKPFSFLSKPGLFWPMLVFQTIWKESGWGTIVFLAAMAGVDIAQYEAAIIDGATRFQRCIYITLPAIAPTIVTMLILRLGAIAEVDFEQLLLMMNGQVYNMAEVFDTYAYRLGIQQGKVSFGTTVSLFKGFIGMAFVWGSDRVVKRFGYDGIF